MFDWQTEDEINWDEPEETPPEKSDKPRRRWLWAGLGLGVLAAVTAVIVWQQVQRRVAETMLRVESDVLASVRVIEQAAIDQDSDLFITFLSGRDADWAAANETAIRDNQFLDRSLFGLQTAADEVVTPQVELTLDLSSATVRTPRSYTLEVGNGIQETVVLSQTAVYRPGPNRWLLSPPDPDFWGEPARYEGVMLNIEYPEAPYNAFELGRDLDQFMTQLCTIMADFRSCSGFAPIQASLTHPAPSLSDIQVLRLPGTNENRTLILSVPSPVAVGLPTDEVSYRALYSGYANLLGIIMIDEMFDSACCLNNPYYHAVRVEMMAQLGVRPSTTALLNQPLPRDTQLYTFGDLAAFWNNNYPIEPVEWLSPIDPVALFIHFLVNEVQVTDPAHLLTDIIGGRFSTFPQWVDLVLSDNPDMDVASLERAWIAYQFSLTAVAQAELPVPLPEKELQLLCTNPQIGYELYRYNLQTETLNFEGALGAVEPQMMALPNGEGVVMGLRTDNPTQARLAFVVNGEQTRLSWDKNSDTPDAMPLGFDPSGTYVVLGGSGNITGLMDYETCLGEGLCNFETTDGFPKWSPDQQNALVASQLLTSRLSLFEEAHPLILGDSLGFLPEEPTEWQLWEGWSSFWFSSTEIGYLAEDNTGTSQTIFKANINGADPEPVLSIDEIVTALPTTLPITGSRLNWVQPHPLKPDSLLLTVILSTTDDSTPSFLIEYDLASESGMILDIFQRSAAQSLKVFDFSPNGRFGTIFGQNEFNQTQLHLFDFEANTIQQTIPNVPLDGFGLVWSDDSEWILTGQGPSLRLTAVHHDYYKLLTFPEAACSTGVWINPIDF